MIVAAAIQINGLTLSMPAPARHHDIIRQWVQLQNTVLGNCGIERDYIECIEGFLTDKGEFLGRRGAYMHAHDCGQGTPKRRTGKQNYQGDELFSEDLW